jgi:hypothetical protein
MIQTAKNILLSVLTLLVLLSPLASTTSVYANCEDTVAGCPGRSSGSGNGNSGSGGSAAGTEQGDINKGLKCGSNLDLGKDVTGAASLNCDADTNKTGAPNFTTTVKKIINILSILVGAIAVIMIIFGGFRYVTSGGSDSSVSSAKNTILYAVIGLIIVALAQVIVHFVLNNIAT